MSQESALKTMHRWLSGAILASIKLVGNRTMKVFTRGMSMAFVNGLNTEHGEPLKEGLGVAEAVNGYRDLEAKAGETAGGSVEVESSESEVKLVFKGCLYADLCNELLPTLIGSGEFTEKTVPCLRASNYSAALALFNRTRWPYHLVQYAPGARCTAVLTKMQRG